MQKALGDFQWQPECSKAQAENSRGISVASIDGAEVYTLVTAAEVLLRMVRETLLTSPALIKASTRQHCRIA